SRGTPFQSSVQLSSAMTPIFLKIFTPFPTTTYEFQPPKITPNFRNIRARSSNSERTLYPSARSLKT
ncbi:MAG: hypothetical protein ACYTE5_05870, partial [Planctomycetota bacterium]